MRFLPKVNWRRAQFFSVCCSTWGAEFLSTQISRQAVAACTWPGCTQADIVSHVEELYCKRPIQCLASSKILTPHPSPPASVYPPSPAFGAGGGHTRWKTPDTALSSTYVSTLWSLIFSITSYSIFYIKSIQGMFFPVRDSSVRRDFAHSILSIKI